MMTHSLSRDAVRTVLMATLVAAVVPSPTKAQSEETLRIEARAGLTAGNHSMSASEFDFAPALSFDLVLRRQVTPGIAAYAGVFRTSFGCTGDPDENGDLRNFCAVGEDDPGYKLVGNHVVAGGEWSPAAMADGPARPWVRVGVMYGSAGMTLAETELPAPESGIGFHTAAGISVGGGPVLFVPSLSRRQMSASQPRPDGESGGATAIAYSIDVAIAYRIGGGP